MEEGMDNNNRAGQVVILGIAALLLLFPPSAAIRPAGAQTVSDVVSSVENHYRDVADITARVVQKNVLKAIGKTQKFEATLLIKKPGKLRLDYTNGQVVLVDGRTALFYSKKSEQVVKRTFTEFENMNIPVAFLLGAAHIRDDFDVLQTDTKTPRSLELLPKKPGAAMKKLLLRSDAAGRIDKLVIVDRSGNTSEVEFADIRENGGIDDRQFVFTAPKGTEIIEQ
jgi:outer membrane lipoprotein carrier protein